MQLILEGVKLILNKIQIEGSNLKVGVKKVFFSKIRRLVRHSFERKNILRILLYFISQLEIVRKFYVEI